MFLHANPLGSTGVTTLANGTFVNDEIYDPWGQRWGTWNFESWAERFAGMQRRDAESGLDHTDFRMFASSYGRWLTPDPLAGDVSNPQSLNRYAYVLNNPTNLIDPLGLFGDCPYGQTNNVCNPLPPPINPCAMLPPASYSGPPSCAPIEPSYPTGPTNTGNGTPGQQAKVQAQPPPHSQTHKYGDYLTCVYNTLVGNQLAEGIDTTFVVNAAAFVLHRSNPWFLVPAALYDLSLELNARAVCSKEVYGP